MVPGFGASAECQSIGTIGKKQRAVARSRGLVIQPQKLLVGAYFELSFLACCFLIHLSNRSDSPRFRSPWKKIVKNMGHNRNRLFSRAIHCPASMEKHYVQWFFLKSVQDITVGEKKLDFAFLSLCGPSHGAWVWCLGRLPKHRNQWQEVEVLLFSPKTLSWCIFLAFVPRVWFPYSSFQQVRQPSIPSPVEEDTTKAWCPGLVSRPSAKAQEPVARSRGLVIQPQKLLVGAYFELSFLGCVS